MPGFSDPPRDEPPQDPLTQLRGLPDRYREVLDASGERGAVPLELVEEAAQTRDLLDSTARRVERLLEDTKPVGNGSPAAMPRRGHHQLDPEVVLEVLDTTAERLARLAEAIPEEVGDRAPGVRDGLESITGELVSEAVVEGERRLRQTESGAGEGG